jgi:hypothetical protein
MKNETVTVELTSKPLKLHKALSIIVFLIGVLVVVGGAIGFGLLLIVVGLVWKWVTEARIYWNHG